MTYAKNSATFKEAERTFSRKRARGAVTAEYEPTEIVYHESFLQQNTWLVARFAALVVIPSVSLFVLCMLHHFVPVFTRMWTDFVWSLQGVIPGLVILCVLGMMCIPYTLYLCVNLASLYRDHNRLKIIFEGGESPSLDLRGRELSAPEPLELTYHPSFVAQYRWHLLGYAVAMISGGILSVMVVADLLTGGSGVALWLVAGMAVSCLSVSPLLVIWRRRYDAMKLLVEEEEISSKPFIAQFE